MDICKAMRLFLFPVSWTLQNKSDVILIERKYTYNASGGLSVVMRFFNKANLTIDVSMLSVNKFCEYYDAGGKTWSWSGCKVSMNFLFQFFPQNVHCADCMETRLNITQYLSSVCYIECI